jgi:regulator of replication initiation timing
VELAQMAPASDPHVLKEAVADLVVERLDSRLAVREKANSSDILYSRISERIDDLYVPVSDVRRAVEDLHTGQESIIENGQTLNRLHQDMAAQLLGLPTAIDNAIGAFLTTAAQLKDNRDTSSGDISQMLPHLDSIEATVRNLVINHEFLAAQSASLVALNEKLQSSVDVLPDSLAEAVASIKETQADIMSKVRTPDQSGEVRNLLATNAELQVQLAKARGAHGQIRVEKDLMFDRMTNAEADREGLRQQLEDLKVKCVNNEREVTAAGLRITELEDALSHSLAHQQSSEVTAKAKDERITTLERQNHEYSLEQYQLKSQVNPYFNDFFNILCLFFNRSRNLSCKSSGSLVIKTIWSNALLNSKRTVTILQCNSRIGRSFVKLQSRFSNSLDLLVLPTRLKWLN